MIRCLYKCRCMQAEAAVEVAERPATQDVVHWVEETVAGAIGADHRARSPLCASVTMEYVKIPAPENAPHLGAAPILDS